MMSVTALIIVTLGIRCISGQVYEDCQPNYVITRDTAYQGGVVQTGVTDEEGCRTKCDADATCIGFDMNLINSPNECYIINDVTSTSSSSTGVHHYTRTTTCPFPFTSERCFFQYKGEKTIASTVGPLRGTNRTVNDCLGSCMDITGCTAAVYKSDRTCHLLLGTLDITAATDETGNQFYAMGQCSQVPLDASCTESYTETLDYGVDQGEYVPNNNSQLACEKTCTASYDCISYDFNLGGAACYLQTDAKKTPVGKPGVNNYRKTKDCQASQKSCTYEAVGTYIPASTYTSTDVSGIISLTECIAACNQDTTCTGVIFNVNFKDGCKKFTGTAFTDRTNLQVTTDGQMGYSRKACGQVTTAPPTPAPGSCITSYREFKQKKLNGALLNAANTLDTCKAACTAASPCWGFDYNSADSTCWLFSGTTPPPYTTPIDSTSGTESHYEKYLKCSSCEYDIYINTKSSQQVYKTAYTTRDSCLSACSTDGTCQGIDYETATNKCYFLTTMPSGSMIQTASGFEQYRKHAPCSSTGTGVCNLDNFDEYTGKKIIGGTLTSTNPQSLANCKAACMNSASCLAYDVNANVECYLITTYGNIVDGVTGEKHYHRQPRCDFGTSQNCDYFATGTFTPPTSQRSLTKTTNTQEECFQSCIDQNVCSGLAYDRATKSCDTYLKTAMWSFSSLTNSANANLEAYEFRGCTSTGSTTTLGGCVDNKWEAFSDTHAQGGLEQTSITTSEDCKSLCINTPDCVAVDIDIVRVPLCYLHLNKANLDNRLSLAGVTLNVLTRCSTTGSTTVTGSSSAGGSTTTPTTAAGCTKQYKLYAGKKIAGGMLVDNNVNTVDSCKAWCDNEAKCAGFDFNKNDNTCWWLQKTGPMETATDGADHYAKEMRCGDCSYEVIPQKSVNLVAGSKTTKQTVEDCLNACSADDNCKSVDYGSDKSCTIFSTSYTSLLVDNTAVTHYERTGCQCTAVYQYQKSLKSKVTGNEFFSGAVTQDACKMQCDSDNSCIGFDFNSQNQCWITKASNKNPIVSSGSEVVDHYTKYAECGNCRYDIKGASAVPSGGMLQSSVNTWKDCISSCTSATPSCQSVDFNTKTNQCYHFSAPYETGLTSNMDVLHFVQKCTSECSATYKYEKKAMSKVIGGTLVASVKTVDSCTTQCTNDQTCIGFDFTGQNQCWATPASNNNPVVSSGLESVDHYIKYAECGDCRYDIKGASAVPSGGMLQSSVNTWKDCISSCTSATPSCQSVDFNTKTNQCYHFSAPYETGLTSNMDVLHFVQKCSSVSTTSSGSSTLITTTISSSGGVTTAPAGSCPISYTSYPKEKVPGLTLSPNIASADQCKSTCTTDVTCVGFDYNAIATAQFACWLQTDITKSRVAQSPGEDVTHYEQKRSCGSCSFKPYTSTRPSSFSVIQGITTEESCVVSCSESSSCKMASFKQNQCYQSTATGKTAESITKTWEKIGTCGTSQQTCTQIYLEYSGKHVIGGTFIDGVTDGPSCRSACDGRTDCVGYDITTSGECWLTVDRQAQRNTLIDGPGVNHYTKVMKCNGVCYRQVMDASYASSTSYGEQTLDNCLLACSTSTQNCRDVIYTPSATQGNCRFVMSSTPVTISTDLNTASGSTFYSQLSSCQDEATQVTAASSATTARPTANP